MDERKILMISFNIFMCLLIVTIALFSWREVYREWVYRNAQRELVSVEVVNKISDTSSFLGSEVVDYIFVLQTDDGRMFSATVDAAAYAAIESDDSIQISFHKKADNSVELFRHKYKLSDFQIAKTPNN